MKIWIDVLTPKQTLFFNVIKGWLTKRGHEVFSTTRAKYGGFELGSLIHYDLMVVGQHGITPYEKLIESSRRIENLAKMISEKKVDLAISFSSPECARVSYGLGIPHLNFSDSPHAIHASRLSIPFSEFLFTPWIIPKNSWAKYGISNKNIVKYKAIDASFWLKKWNFRDMKKELDLENKPIIVIRMHEEYASYLLDRKGNPLHFLKQIIEEQKYNANMIVLARYQKQYSSLKSELGPNIRILDSIVDGPSLIKCSDVFIGLGGTMSHEAALLGIPAISAYPGRPTLIEDFLIRKKLLYRSSDTKKLRKVISRFLSNERLRNDYKKRSANLWSSFEDPEKKIIPKIELLEKKV